MTNGEKGDWTTGNFRPKKIEDMALYPELRQLLMMDANDDDLGHTIMVGHYGTGKTTAARIIGDHERFSVIEVDCAADNNIDAIRKIMRQTTTISLFGKQRLFILDEFHRVAKDTQTLLCKVMEDRKERNKFIFCVNDYTKIDGAIKSRAALRVFNIGYINPEDNKFKIIKQNTSMTLEGWKNELKKIGKSISLRAGMELPDEIINELLSRDDNIKDARNFLIALQQQFKMHLLVNQS